MARTKKAEKVDLDGVVHYELSHETVLITIYRTDPKGDVWTAKGNSVMEPSAIEAMRAHLEQQVRACWGA